MSRQVPKLIKCFEIFQPVSEMFAESRYRMMTSLVKMYLFLCDESYTLIRYLYNIMHQMLQLNLFKLYRVVRYNTF